MVSLPSYSRSSAAPNAPKATPSCSDLLAERAAGSNSSEEFVTERSVGTSSKPDLPAERSAPYYRTHGPLFGTRRRQLPPAPTSPPSARRAETAHRGSHRSARRAGPSRTVHIPEDGAKSGPIRPERPFTANCKVKLTPYPSIVK